MNPETNKHLALVSGVAALFHHLTDSLVNNPDLWLGRIATVVAITAGIVSMYRDRKQKRQRRQGLD